MTIFFKKIRLSKKLSHHNTASSTVPLCNCIFGAARDLYTIVVPLCSRLRRLVHRLRERVVVRTGPVRADDEGGEAALASRRLLAGGGLRLLGLLPLVQTRNPPPSVAPRLGLDDVKPITEL